MPKVNARLIKVIKFMMGGRRDFGLSRYKKGPGEFPKTHEECHGKGYIDAVNDFFLSLKAAGYDVKYLPGDDAVIIDGKTRIECPHKDGVHAKIL